MNSVTRLNRSLPPSILALLASAVFATAAPGYTTPEAKQAPQTATASKPVIGTISDCGIMLGNAIGTDAKTPARFAGIMFRLREYPGRDYIFKSPTFEHQGRNLTENLKGLMVSLVCEADGDDPSTVEISVVSLNWLPAADASRSPASGPDPKLPPASVGERILGDTDFFTPEFAKRVRAAAPGEGMAVPAPCPEMAKCKAKYGNADSVKVEIIKVKDGPTVMLAMHYYGDIGLGVANEVIMAVLKK
jgi:hypothetical protein